MRRRIIYLLRIIGPYVLWVFQFIIRMTLITAVANLSGLPKACDKIASDWVARAINAGFPSLHEDWLYRVLYVVGLAQYIVGWIVLSHLTVWLFRWVF